MTPSQAIKNECKQCGVKRARLESKGHVAVLSKYRHKKQEIWLLTGWKEGASDVSGSDSALSRPTHTRPTLNRSDMGAETPSLPANKNIPQPPQSVKEQPKDKKPPTKNADMGDTLNPSAENKHIDSRRTVEKIADQHKISRETVKRAEKFAEAIDTIAETIGQEVKQGCPSGCSFNRHPLVTGYKLDLYP